MESSSSKRAKAPGNTMTQIAHCLVDNCTADLRLCRDYHRRHKVCEFHSKEPKVTIGNREQRFCQQCSRFHSLVEFDEGKRSCRKRLDGHNRRRRKPQPDSLSRTPGLVFSSPPSGRLLSFSSPQILPSAILGSSWAGPIKPEPDTMLYNHQQQQQQQQQQINYIDRQNSFQECLSQPHKSINQMHFFSDGLTQDRALSLLSPPPPPSTREFGLAQPSYNYNGLGPQYSLAQENKAVVSSSGSSDPSSMQIPDIFQAGPDDSSTSGSHQTLTFMWE